MFGFGRPKNIPRRQPAGSPDKNKVYMYRSRRPDEDKTLKRSSSEREREGEGRLARALRSAGFVAGVLLFIVVVIYSTALGSTAKVVINGDGEAIRPIRTYQAEADKILGQSLNNRWKVSIKRSDIAGAIKQSFPEIKEVQVSTPPWSYQPIIKLTMGQPGLVLISSGEKYLVNGEGIAVIKLSEIESDSINNLPQVIDETGYVVEDGQQILSNEQVRFIQEVIYQTNQKKLEPSEIRLKPGGEEVHFKFKGYDYLIKFSFDTDARRSVGAFLALKKYLDSNGPLPSEYIDVRVSERAYVR